MQQEGVGRVLRAFAADLTLLRRLERSAETMVCLYE